MAAIVALFWICALIQIQQGCSAPLGSSSPSPFTLKIEPITIVRGVTANVTMTCGRDPNTPSSLHTISTIRILRQDQGEWSLVAYVRDNENEPHSSSDCIMVSANINGSVDNSSIIIQWPVAKPDTFGTYRCDVMGFSKDLTGVVESSPEFLVTENDVTAKSLLDFLLDVKKKTEEEIHDVKGTLEHLSQKQESNFTSLKESLTQNIKDLDNRVENLESEKSHWDHW